MKVAAWDNCSPGTFPSVTSCRWKRRSDYAYYCPPIVIQIFGYGNMRNIATLLDMELLPPRPMSERNEMFPRCHAHHF